MLTSLYIYAAKHVKDSILINSRMLGVKIGKEDIKSQDWKGRYKETYPHHIA